MTDDRRLRDEPPFRPDGSLRERDTEAMTMHLSAADMPSSREADEARIVLSFDVEEHFRIEAAAGMEIPPGLKARYAERVGPVTRWLLGRLGERGIKATFFIVGELARNDPGLVREIHAGGHEVASHGWDHRRVLAMSPEEFREDLWRSVDVLQQITGEAVSGYRAPTFSIVRKTAWAIDVLAGSGLIYDSSIHPVRHDRYGIPDAPRSPFFAEGPGGGRILELPPATLRVGRVNLPIGGGGYFRLLPWAVTGRAIRRALRDSNAHVTILYFHPWEFDPDQPRLPLGRSGRFRTYVGIRRTRARLDALLADGHRCVRAVDLARRLDDDGNRHVIPRFILPTRGPATRRGAAGDRSGLPRRDASNDGIGTPSCDPIERDV